MVGVIDANGRRVIAYGSLAKGDDRKPNGDTVFEIGSISKMFTSLALMDMVRRGEVALERSGVEVPAGFGQDAGAERQEDHTRGPFDAALGAAAAAGNMAMKDPSNPYVDYTVQQMYDFLSGYTLTRDIGAQYEYSNLGVGLLGHVLALRAGMSYEALVRWRESAIHWA